MLLVDTDDSATDRSMQSKMDPPGYPIARVLTRPQTRTGAFTGVKPAPGRPSPSPRLTSLTSRTGRHWENLWYKLVGHPPCATRECLATANTSSRASPHPRDAERPLGSASFPGTRHGDGELASSRRHGTDLQPWSLGGLGHLTQGSDRTAGPCGLAVRQLPVPAIGDSLMVRLSLKVRSAPLPVRSVRRIRSVERC